MRWPTDLDYFLPSDKEIDDYWWGRNGMLGFLYLPLTRVKPIPVSPSFTSVAPLSVPSGMLFYLDFVKDTVIKPIKRKRHWKRKGHTR
jgi:hypothetical protein